MTKFKLLCQSCGFTMKAAAEYLEIPYGTAESYWNGTRGCPDWVLLGLKDFFAAQDSDARQLVKVSKQHKASNIEASGIGKNALYRRILELADDDTMLKIKFVERE